MGGGGGEAEWSTHCQKEQQRERNSRGYNGPSQGGQGRGRGGASRARKG